MIVSFACKDTERLFEGAQIRRFQAFHLQAVKRLTLLDSATSLSDLAGLPSNRLEALGGDRLGSFSIRVNKRWRVCFVWAAGEARLVEIVDYH